MPADGCGLVEQPDIRIIEIVNELTIRAERSFSEKLVMLKGFIKAHKL
jgi:predicted DNA-binding transcriptional regulator